MILPFFVAWAGHSEESRTMAADFVKALDIHDIKHDAAAETMGVPPTKFSEQIAGRLPLNHWRIARLGAGFELTYLKLRAARHNATLLTAEDRAIILGFYTAGLKMLFDDLAGWRCSSTRRRRTGAGGRSPRSC